MRLRPVAFALVLALAPSAVGAPAFAQDDATTADARARFKEGVRYYEAGQYERARASFLQAYALKKHPDVLFNLANACLKSGHPHEAEHDFSQWLHDGDGVTPQKRADAEKGRDEARSKLGRIDIQAPSGSQISVDGEAANAGESVYVDPGAHVVKYRATDGTEQSTSVAVLSGQAKTASFGKTAAPVPVPVPTDTAPTPPTPPPTPPPSDTTTNPPADTSTPPPDTSKPPESSDSTRHHAGITTPPDNLVPVAIGLGLTIVGFGVGLGAGVFAKNSAQNSATSIADQIRSYLAEPKNMGAGGLDSLAGSAPCSSTNSKVVANIGQACSQLSSNNNKVNTDATVGNIGLAVGIVGLVGTAIYWAVASRDGSDSRMTATSSVPTITPVVGPTLNGFSISGAF